LISYLKGESDENLLKQTQVGNDKWFRKLLLYPTRKDYIMEKSKSFITFTLFAALVTIFITSCGKDDESPTEPSAPIDIVGTWDLTKMTLTTPTDTTVTTTDELAIKMILKSDHTFAEITVFDQDSTSSRSGTWSISGSTVVIEGNHTILTVFIITTFEENNMTLTETLSSGIAVSEWVRQ